IGIDGNGAAGTLYVDDIRLYAYSRQLITPTDPGNAGLVAHYKLDQNANDSSGNGHNGTVEGVPTWASPGWDGTDACMKFGGDADRITVEPFEVMGSGITLSAWINPVTFKNDARLISKSAGSSTQYHIFAIVLSGSGEDTLQFRLKTNQGSTTSHTSGGEVEAGEWSHIAVTWDAGDPVMREYINGVQVGSTDKAGTAVATDPDAKIGLGNQSISALAQGPGGEIRPFDGLLDEVHVYERGLSVSELAWLSGRTQPFDEPF
ncbi:MAG: LamG domain-containing protein, partial [Planctomycetota bacterium]